MILILDSFLNHSWFLIHSWIILDSWLLILDYRNDCILFINKILAKNSIHYYDIFIWVFKLYIWLCVLSILPASRILTIILVTLVISVLPTTSVLSAYLFYLLTCSTCLLVLSAYFVLPAYLFYLLEVAHTRSIFFWYQVVNALWKSLRSYYHFEGFSMYAFQIITK